MAANDTLVVPIEVSAFAVNPAARDTDGTYAIHRWTAVFQDFGTRRMSPEPDPFTELQPWRDDPSRLGVHLMWHLPEGLTQGHESGDADIEFPLVPNRWLVVRSHGTGSVRSWIVESDHLGNDGTSAFLDPFTDRPTATRCGRLHELTATAPWREPDRRPEPFLTALGPGLLSFAAFQPYNRNVLSMHDTLDDVSGDARVSYRVIGWYAQESADILQRGGFDEVMADLGWLLPSMYGRPGASVYAGSVIGLDWRPDRGAPAPPSDIPAADTIVVGIGHSTAEAAAAVEAEYGLLDAEEARLFHAFALGCLDRAERTDGDLFPARAALLSGFGPLPGGYVWRVVDRGNPADAPREDPAAAAARAAVQAERIAELNRLQRAHDLLERELHDAREYLYHLWALDRRRSRPPFFGEGIRDRLDATVAGSPAHAVADLATRLAAARAAIPWALDQEELDDKAQAYASAWLAAPRVLQRYPAAEYQEAADPVLLLRGAGTHAPLTRDSALPCRVEERLVTRIGTVTARSVAADVAEVNTEALPAIVPRLLTEHFIVDRVRADQSPLSPVDGLLPEYGTRTWRQPWQPLFLAWRADYKAIDYADANGERHWEFDGQRYRWRGTGRHDYGGTISGRQILTPTSGFVTAGRLDAYAKDRKDLDREAIDALRRILLETDELSQRLDGFSAQIGQRLIGSGLRPHGDLAADIGDGDSAGAPRPGIFPAEEWESWMPSDFQQLRAGLVEFRELAIVDRFGRAVVLVEHASGFEIARPDSFVPDQAPGGIEPDRFVQLTPRILQPARLALRFLDQRTGTEADLVADGNPVSGWLLHNRVDDSLACYGPAGAALGDLRITGVGAGRRVSWNALPGSTVFDLDDLAELAPYAHELLAGVVRRGPAGFTALVEHLEEAHALIDPQGPAAPAPAYFFGRPVALVRMSVGIELLGAPRRDVSWRTIFEQPEPEIGRYTWNVRLGEARQLDDGLIGYVRAGDADHIETVLPTGGEADYLRSIDRGQRLLTTVDGPPPEVTLLIDPRGAVHATTGVLPVVSAHIPPAFVDDALRSIAIAFRAGPLVAPVTTDGAGTEHLLALHPALAGGSWTWAERRGDTWLNLPMAAPDPDLWPLGRDPRIRTGFVVLGDAATIASAGPTAAVPGPTAPGDPHAPASTPSASGDRP
ncbi:hypothetical protein B4N89_29890 [Embleya scabrispora]|uniref:Uncharacterized protein n=1 Tax=Embleya scabrispora TaxID=159449 RepID=A0A1T3P6K5_9ACTN|nr:hypothetical protein [Embleya scabrispora]OPC84575.1 hypothetical protein B4N89_29890 [Embleya scabrispora]